MTPPFVGAKTPGVEVVAAAADLFAMKRRPKLAEFGAGLLHSVREQASSSSSSMAGDRDLVLSKVREPVVSAEPTSTSIGHTQRDVGSEFEVSAQHRCASKGYDCGHVWSRWQGNWLLGTLVNTNTCFFFTNPLYLAKATKRENAN